MKKHYATFLVAIDIWRHMLQEPRVQYLLIMFYILQTHNFKGFNLTEKCR